MATPTFANNCPPLSDLGKGAKHQSVRYSAPQFNPAHYNPVPVAANLAGGILGTAYSETISVQGGTSPYTFAVTSGALPTSTTLNTSTGVISGTPSVTGTFTFTITVTDALGFTGSQSFQIIVAIASSGGSFTFLG